MSQDWDIKPCGDKCGCCGNPFQDKQPHLATLIFAEGGYERHDFCEECGAKPDVTQKLSPHSTWRARYKSPIQAAPEVLKKETAESLLRKFMESGDSSKRNVIYVLAVMLERKRIFIERDIQLKEDGSQVLVYEYKKTGEMFMIPDPGLKLAKLESVQAEVAELLGAKPRAASPEPPQPQQS